MAVPNHKKIQHLYNRAGFGLSPVAWNSIRNIPVSQAVDDLFAGTSQKGFLQQMDVSFVSGNTAERNAGREKFMQDSGQVLWQRNLDWVNQMATGETSPLIEKMTLFWHGHFANHVRFGHTAVQQINNIKQHALGNFRDLLLGTSKDPGVLNYLNANANRKDDVNENFGRELLELYSMGIGNYTQKDVVEVSRAFTGWSHSEFLNFMVYDHFHDNGIKTFLGRTGNFNGDDIIDIIMEQPATARFITRKIYAYFVNENIHEKRVNDLAEEFFKSNFDIGKLMRSILGSSWFYDEENIATKIKSPIELIVGSLKVLGIRLQEKVALIKLENALGQKLFEPPSVAGWPSGRLWINNANILLRLGLATYLTKTLPLGSNFKKIHIPNLGISLPDQKISGVGLNELKEVFGCCQPNDLAKGLEEYILQISAGRSVTVRPTFSPEEKLLDAVLQLMSLPEYQVC